MSPQEPNREQKNLIEHIKDLFLPQPPPDEEIMMVLSEYDHKAISRAIAAMRANQINQFQVFKRIIKYFSS